MNESVREEVVLRVLDRLEAENRRLKRALAAGVVLVLAVFSTAMVLEHRVPQGRQVRPARGAQPAQATVQNVVRTRKLEITDTTGKVVAVLQAPEERDEPGFLKEYHSNGRRRWRVAIKDNRYHGKYIAWWPSGIKQKEGNYRAGREHGLFTTYHSQGQPSSSGAYDRGRKTGIWTYWSASGQKIREGLYENDLMSGAWREYYENGENKRLTNYKRGVKAGATISWSSNGKKRTEGTYDDNGQLTGIYKSFHVTGTLARTSTYEHGTKVGLEKEWWPDGTKRSEGRRNERGRMTGEWKYWNADGEIDTRRSGTYENNRRIRALQPQAEAPAKPKSPRRK